MVNFYWLQQAVHIARALIQVWQDKCYAEPGFVLMDEPTSSLDLAQEMKILKILQKEVNKGLGALIVFHDLNLAAHVSDRIAILSAGGSCIWKPKRSYDC